jgi:hypothetical protein
MKKAVVVVVVRHTPFVCVASLSFYLPQSYLLAANPESHK